MKDVDAFLRRFEEDELYDLVDLRPCDVLIMELDREDWATGWELLSDKYGSGFSRRGVGRKE